MPIPIEDSELGSFRHRILGDFAVIEDVINMLIYDEYGRTDREKRTDDSKVFVEDILMSNTSGFGLKIELLEKIIQRYQTEFSSFLPENKVKTFIGVLRRLNKIRNYFAHSSFRTVTNENHYRTSGKLDFGGDPRADYIEFNEIQPAFWDIFGGIINYLANRAQGR